MTKRNMALTAAKIAGYHNDIRTFTRLVIECRVNRKAMDEAWHYGVAAKQGGIKCHCYECTKAANQPNPALDALTIA